MTARSDEAQAGNQISVPADNVCGIVFTDHMDGIQPENLAPEAISFAPIPFFIVFNW